MRAEWIILQWALCVLWLHLWRRGFTKAAKNKDKYETKCQKRGDRCDSEIYQNHGRSPFSMYSVLTFVACCCVETLQIQSQSRTFDGVIVKSHSGIDFTGTQNDFMIHTPD